MKVSDFKNMSEEKAMKRLKYLNKEIRKHEIVFLIFVCIGILNTVLTFANVFNFSLVTLFVPLYSIYICYKIFKFSEPYEIEKYYIEIIFKENKKGEI